MAYRLDHGPHPTAIASLVQAMKYRERAVVCCSYGQGLAPRDAVFTAGVPKSDECNGTSMKLSHTLDEIISIDTCIMLKDKGSLPRLARAHLILFERDFARGNTIQLYIRVIGK